VKEHRWALGALVFLLGVTAAWWALALWPLPETSPAWLARARNVCFNVTETGLPGVSGWLLLVGQPLGMVGVLLVGWGRPVARGIRALARLRRGRVAVGIVVAGGAAGLVGAGIRVADAIDRTEIRLGEGTPFPEALPRLDRPVPAFELVDQNGWTVSTDDLSGRPAFVTFAFGNCETVCPLVVRNALEARRRLQDVGKWKADRRPTVVVVTLDPWRDTPTRLAHLAEHWGLGPGDRVLGGPSDRVNAALDGWKVPRKRDLRTGDIAHPSLVYLLDAQGRIAFRSRGDVESLVELGGRL